MTLRARRSPLLFSLVVVATAAFATGRKEQERYPVEWFNFGEYSETDASTQLMVEAIEKRFPVELTLSGGPLGSDRSVELLARADKSARMPDVFPWFRNWGSSLPSYAEPFCEIEMQELTAHMPGTYATLARICAEEGLDLTDILSDYSYAGAIHCLPKRAYEYLYSYGILWRQDILDEVNLPSPATIDDWEEIFRRHKLKSPDKTPWISTWGMNRGFWPVFAATGEDLESYVVRDGRVVRGYLTDEIKRPLSVLQRWHERGYIAIADSDGLPEEGYAGAEHNPFIAGEAIVDCRVYPFDGN